MAYYAASASSEVSAGKTVKDNVALWSVPGVGTVETPAEVFGGGVAEIKYSNATLPTSIDCGVYFHESGFSPVSFKVRRNITEPIYESSTTCVNVVKRDDINNTDYNETSCTYESVQTGSVTYEADVSLPVQYSKVQDFVYSYVTVGGDETVKVEMPMLIGNKSVEYSVIAKPTSESWAGSKIIEVDPKINGVYFKNSSNFSIKINVPSSVTMPPWYPVYSINITGIPEKNANSTDIRLVETNTGHLICFDVISNTSSSAEIVPLVNFSSPSENKTFVLYWGNSSVGTFDNSCPNQMNWQDATHKMIIPERAAGWDFNMGGLSNANTALNISGSTYFGLFPMYVMDDQGAAVREDSGDAILVFDGKVVKIVKLTHNTSGKTALVKFYAFNNFTETTFQGFTAAAGDGIYGMAGTGGASAQSVYFRTAGGDFNQTTGGTAHVDTVRGMFATGADSAPWFPYIFMNDSLLQKYANGNSICSYTRGQAGDPQIHFPATDCSFSSYSTYLGNFTIYSGPTLITQAALNDTYALRNATWTWSWSPQIEPVPTNATESEGDMAIEAGVNSALPSATKYANQKVYLVNTSNSQWQGRVDFLVVQTNPQRRWLINYVTNGESYLNAQNLSNVVYTLEMANLTYEQITAQVMNLLSATKG